jgi:unsaturated rhamnogalacturonyl hydrolase
MESLPPNTPISVQMTESMIQRHQVSKWHYEHGLLMMAIWHVAEKTGNADYKKFVRAYVDGFVQEDGSINTYRKDEFNLDQINPGKVLLLLLKEKKEDKYVKAVEILRNQLRNHPRTASKGFWHKKIYPNQMWLDGIYMGSPFYAEYASMFNDAAAFDDIALQILLLEEKARDKKTGLLYHAWDESKEQQWANKETGCSPHFWGRALGWYAMALVDILDFMPKDHKDRAAIIAVMDRLAAALAHFQDSASGMWYQVLDQGSRSGNYLETSGSSMFVYALAKAVRMGYISKEKYLPVAQKGYKGLVDTMLKKDAKGLLSLGGICSVAGLGGTPYRDGSFEYYVSEKIVDNDYKGVGPFILASLEIESIK